MQQLHLQELSLADILEKRCVLKIYETFLKKTCGRAAFLEKLQSARIFQRFPCALRKWLILHDKFWRHFRKHIFLCDTK